MKVAPPPVKTIAPGRTDRIAPGAQPAREPAGEQAALPAIRTEPAVPQHASWSRAAPPAADRELERHAVELGVPLDGDVATAIQHAELLLGQHHEQRVSQADMARAVRFSEQAGSLVPARQRDLFGFTRVVDAKVNLDAAVLDALARACGNDAALWRAIDEGPGHGEIVWKRPSSRTELVASLVRQIVLGAGASRQITLAPDLTSWLHESLAHAGADVRRAMGGAGAFAANLASAVGTESVFFSREPLPDAIVDRFAPAVQAMDAQGRKHPVAAHRDGAAARTNTAAEYAAGQALSLLGKTSVRVNGEERAVVPQGTGRVIFGTEAKDVKPGFDGVSDEALARMARETDLFFFVGAHYLTQGSAEAARADAAQLARALEVMKAANPKLLRHAQYVVPKVPENEAVVLGALRGRVDSLALNTVEAAPLLDALVDGGLSNDDVDPLLPREAAEDPARMTESALALQRALGLRRVHLHGLEGDLVLSLPGSPGADDPDRQRLALVKARQLAANKAANDSGEIKSRDDVWPVVPSVRGTGLAALHRFADALQERHGLSDAARDKIVERWWYQDPTTKSVLHFVPSRGIHDRTGGTVSLGDTIDSAGLIYALRPERAPRLLHGSSFR